ncbi:MAG: hypothetical protein IJ689_04880 [Alphaproteobacteria bacterium]|nr:hypothetical protein [Alphaproteobacteria bacterium]
MKNYILLLGIAAVSIGSYCAYAGNSATMTVTATIAHDVSLTLEGNTMDFGTIYIDPSNTEGGYISYGESGEITHQDAYFVSASPVTPINFTANIPHPEACQNHSNICQGLSFDENDGEVYVFGGSKTNYCQLIINYTGSGNNFKILLGYCDIYYPEYVTPGDYEGTVTISYTPS